MNPAHLHLALNHIPVLGTLFGLLLLALAAWRKSDELKRLSLWVFAAVAVLAIPAYLSGEPAEEMVEHLPGVSESLIKAHEEAAEAAFICLIILGTAATVGLVISRRGKRLPAWFSVPTMVLALVVGGLMTWTANLGGKVRHTEIRAGNDSSPGVLRNPPARHHRDD